MSVLLFPVDPGGGFLGRLQLQLPTGGLQRRPAVDTHGGRVVVVLYIETAGVSGYDIFRIAQKIQSIDIPARLSPLDDVLLLVDRY